VNRSLLSLRGLSKSYPSVIACDAIDLDVAPGEIHAVLGENGAGKSTLMKLIYGATRPDAGTLAWRGQPVEITSPARARALGIGMVFQHFSLFESLSVVQNIALATGGKLPALARRIEQTGARFGLPIDPAAPVHALSVGERQRVEIVRCLLQDPQLLIMDEPTSVLPPQGVEQLFDTLRLLAEQGCAILYISHKLAEIVALCHSATVLRDGRVVGHADPRRESPTTLARMMIGRDPPPGARGSVPTSTRRRLSVEALSHRPDDPFGTALHAVSLHVNGGEILGIAGVSGNGQNELVRLLSGETRRHRATVTDACLRLDDRPLDALGPGERRTLGLNVVPEERLGRGAVPPMSLADNALLTAHDRGLSRWGFIRRQRTAAFARDCIDGHDVRCGGEAAVAASLSGGNLQKYIVGREIALRPSVFVLSQPTWGVDVGAAANIRRALVALRDAGAALLVVSEELDELLEITDRLQVMHAGRLSPSLATEGVSLDTVGAWMTGGFDSDGAARTLHDEPVAHG